MNKLFAYPGGKTPIRKVVVSAFPPKETIKTFADVFGGSGVILFEAGPYPGEIFNDKNELLVNFFRVVKHRPAELAERAKHWIHSRALWEQYRDNLDRPLDEIERAFLFWVRLQDSFGGIGGTYGMSKVGIRSVTGAREYLDQIAQRLKGVHIECCSFEKCIRNYDSPETFFYLDPPYPGTAGGDTNYNLLSIDEWKLLKEILDNIKGKFLLSCNDDPFVLKLFKGFHIRKIKVRVTLSRKKGLAARNEILVSNYEQPRMKRHTPVYAADKPAAKRIARKSIRKECVK